jgi:RNA polymerase sigma factor (sigma-70 family)
VGSELKDIAGKSKDFDEFVRRYSDVLRRFFQKRILEWADIDDLVQEVFMRLARRGISDIDNVEGYMFQAAANVLRDRFRYRAAKRVGSSDQLDESFAEDAAFSPERVLLGREAVEQMTLVLQELPERTQAIFVLSRFEDLCNSEVATRLGISVSAVEKHLVRALARLSERLKDDL